MRSHRLMPGRTVIMIAHRLSSVRNFDRIVVLEAGQIVQDGPPEQLMRQDGVYRALIEREMRHPHTSRQVRLMRARLHAARARVYRHDFRDDLRRADLFQRRPLIPLPRAVGE